MSPFNTPSFCIRQTENERRQIIDQLKGANKELEELRKQVKGASPATPTPTVSKEQVDNLKKQIETQGEWVVLSIDWNVFVFFVVCYVK